MAKKFLQLGALLGALSVILGAFSAHALKGKLDTNLLSIFQTGVQYQFYHTFALLMVGWIALKNNNKWFRYAGIFFILGIVCFSGSLYLLANRFLLKIESWSWLGPITPIGGLCFIIGWVLFFIGVSILKNDE